LKASIVVFIPDLLARIIYYFRETENLRETGIKVKRRLESLLTILSTKI
jgi:hypothetical protein